MPFQSDSEDLLILNPTLISWANLPETLLLSLLVIVFSDLTILGLKFERLFIFCISHHLLQWMSGEVLRRRAVLDEQGGSRG
jgi:hypothetical protein